MEYRLDNQRLIRIYTEKKEPHRFLFLYLYSVSVSYPALCAEGKVEHRQGNDDQKKYSRRKRK